jgi:hypothetical protein
MTTNGFAQDQTLYTVTIKWKHGFTHSYEQRLNDKQLATEQERIENLRWVESVTFEHTKPA